MAGRDTSPDEQLRHGPTVSVRSESVELARVEQIAVVHPQCGSCGPQCQVTEVILDHKIGVAIVASVLSVEHHSLERSLSQGLSPVPVRLALVAERLDIVQKQRIDEMLISARI